MCQIVNAIPIYHVLAYHGDTFACDTQIDKPASAWIFFWRVFYKVNKEVLEPPFFFLAIFKCLLKTIGCLINDGLVIKRGAKPPRTCSIREKLDHSNKALLFQVFDTPW
jgi:hypothetical protein